MSTPQAFMRRGDTQRLWQKYCGFLELSLTEFMEIQEQLLMEQIQLLAPTALGMRFLPDKRPTSVEEFRQGVPLTVYDDYTDFLGERRPELLPEEPREWVHTSGRGGSFKWVPYTQRAYERMVDSVMAGFILACATTKGEVNLKDGYRVLYNLPARPYFSGMVAHSMVEQFPMFRMIPPLDQTDKLEFQERVEEGFRTALRTGVDIIGSLTSILVKVGERFAERSQGMSFTFSMLHPAVLWRVARAILRSRMEGRPMLPKDLWPVRGVLCGGTDTAIYRDQLIHYWGHPPFEYYAATEAGFIAMQSWNRKAMTLNPYACFYEFIPEPEWLKSRDDPKYSPQTILLTEVRPGQRYELVITNFYGMPFLRYRLGDLIRVVSLEEEETQVKLPQITFEARIDDLIDIAGFTRLDERTVWQAIVNSGVKHEDWAMRKEYEAGEPVIRIYMELLETRPAAEVAQRIHRSLVDLDLYYRDLDNVLEMSPLRVLPLSRGTFQRYLQEKQGAGFDLAHLKPPHMNPSDEGIADLLRLSALA